MSALHAIVVGLGLALAAAIALACAPAAAAPAPVYADPAEGARWAAVAAQLAPAVEGWSDAGLKVLGGFTRARWCRAPVSPADCRAGALPRSLGQPQGLVELSALQRGGPHFGLSYRVIDVPDAGLGLDLSLVAGGQGLIADQLLIRFVRAGAPAGAPAVLTLADRLRYPIGEGAVEVALPGARDPLSAAAALRSSPAELALRAEGQLLALRAAVLAALEAGTLRVCAPGPYRGGGEPPECAPRPLTPAEVDAERAKVEALVREGQAALAAEGAAMHALLRRWLPA